MKLKSIINNLLGKTGDKINLTTVDILGMQKIHPYYVALKKHTPITGASLNPSTVSLIMNDIVINRRKVIVEFGSGFSTFIISKFLQSNSLDCVFISIEEDEDWASLVNINLESEGLSPYCKCIHIPIVQNNDHLWYDESVLKNVLNNLHLKIDQVIVDAPQAYHKGKEGIRYWALPNVMPFLSDNFSIFLDDVHRNGENKILKDWSTKYNLKYEIKNQILGVLNKGKNYTI